MTNKSADHNQVRYECILLFQPARKCHIPIKTRTQRSAGGDRLYESDHEKPATGRRSGDDSKTGAAPARERNIFEPFMMVTFVLKLKLRHQREIKIELVAGCGAGADQRHGEQKLRIPMWANGGGQPQTGAPQRDIIRPSRVS